MRQLPLLTTAVAINCLVIIVHALALTLLRRYKQHHLSGNQVDLLIALSVTELAYGFVDTGYKISLLLEHGIFGIARNIFWVFSITTIILMYMMIMILITLDRFLIFYCNIKYAFYWSKNKNRCVLILFGILSTMSFAPALTVALQNPVYVGRTLVRYIYPPFEFVFIIVALLTYSYIFLRHRDSIIIPKVRKDKNARDGESNSRVKPLVPSLIILTCLVFMIVPNTSKLFYSIGVTRSDEVLEVSYIFTPLGFLVDPIIYMFNTRSVKIFLRRMVSKNSVYSAENSESASRKTSSF